MSDNQSGSTPPFYILRRVPTKYRRILPLGVMKRHQCLVVGAAPGVLTLAITERHNASTLETIQRLTGCRIFPVLIEPARLRLLLQRMERYLHYGHKPVYVFELTQLRYSVRFILTIRPLKEKGLH